jgi:hypothetical protein
MTSLFADLKRSGQNSLNRLTSELEKLSTPNGSSSRDDRFWQPQVDKAGNGYAVIRFLPASPNEDVPFVRMWSHGFQGPGGWYIENSLSTIGKPDAIGELNSKLWNSGIDSDKDTVRKQKRRLNFYSNIYVVKDPANPENEGKVFLFKYGKKIFDKINDMMNPQFDDEKPVNPFDLWSGANFKLKIRQVEGYRNYDKSEFSSAGPLLEDDAAMEKIWQSQYSLQELIAPDKFKTYDELKARLNKVLGESTQAAQYNANADHGFSAPAALKGAEPKPMPQAVDDDDDDVGRDFFKSLAEDD